MGTAAVFAYSFACNGISMRVPSAKTYYSNSDSAKRQMRREKKSLFSSERERKRCRERERTKKMSRNMRAYVFAGAYVYMCGRPRVCVCAYERGKN